MLIDLVRPETWDELNDELHSLFALTPKNKARVYQGLGQAVFEIAQGTAQFMSHKKAIGVIRGQSPVFEGLLPYYYKETYDVTSVSHLALSDVKSFVDGLKRDTNFVLFAEDHPVTGAIYPFAEELDKLLNEKRIFSFRVSHAQHRMQKSELRPYTVRLCSLTPDLAVALLGERFRSPSLLVHQQAWSKQAIHQTLATFKELQTPQQDLVEKFEAHIHAQIPSYFAPGSSRLFDRAVVVIPDASAEAVAQLLFKKLNLPAEEGWKLIESTNQCRWATGVKTFKSWWEPAPSPESLRGMLVISLEALQLKDFANLLISSYEETKELQSWTV